MYGLRVLCVQCAHSMCSLPIEIGLKLNACGSFVQKQRKTQCIPFAFRSGPRLRRLEHT